MRSRQLPNSHATPLKVSCDSSAEAEFSADMDRPANGLGAEISMAEEEEDDAAAADAEAAARTGTGAESEEGVSCDVLLYVVYDGEENCFGLNESGPGGRCIFAIRTSAVSARMARSNMVGVVRLGQSAPNPMYRNRAGSTGMLRM